MKKINHFLKIAVLCAVVLAAVLIAACSLGFDPPSSGAKAIPSGFGAARLSIAGSRARTVFPDNINAFEYAAEFTCVSDTTKDPVTENFTGGACVVTLSPGMWNIVITAKVGDDIVGQAAVNGVNIVDGETTYIDDILIQPKPGADGTLDWTLTFPNDIDEVTLSYGKAAEVAASGTFTNVVDLATDIVNGEASDTIDLEPGSWLVSALLKKNGSPVKQAGQTEVVHIYSGQNSTIAWTFDATQFVDIKPLTGSVTINYADEIISVTLNANELLTPVSLTEGSGGEWEFVTDIPGTIEELTGVYLTITTDEGVFIIDLGDIPYGTGDVSIPDVAIVLWTLTADVGANGSLTVNGEPYTEPLVLKDGTAVTLTAIPDSGYELSALTVNSVSYTGEFLIDADTAVVATFIPIQVTSVEITGGPLSILSGDTSTNGETGAYTASVLPANAADKTLTWSVSDTSAYSSAATATAGSIDAATGVLTPDPTITASTDIYVFASATDGSGVKSTGYKVTVKHGKVWNFSKVPFTDKLLALATGSNGALSTTNLPDFEGTGLSFVSTSEIRYNTNSQTIDGYSFTHRFQYNGSGNGTTNRTLRFDVTGPAKITVYAATSSSGNSRILSLSIPGNPVQTCSVDPLARCEYTVPVMGTCSLYPDNGLNLYLIKVEYFTGNEPVESVAVSGPTSVMAGDGSGNTGGTIQMLKSVLPAWANQTVTWALFANSDGTGDASATATINATTGVLTATDNDIANDTDVYVFATSANGASGNVVSAAYTVTVKKYDAGGGGEPVPGLARISRGNASDTVTYTAAAGETPAKLTINGIGTLSSSVNQGHLLYVTTPVKANIVDAQVDILINECTFGGSASNNANMGLVVIRGDPTTKTAAGMEYFMATKRQTLLAAPYRSRKIGNDGHNGGSSYGSAPSNTTIVETLGIKYNNSLTSTTFSQKLDSAAAQTQNDTNALFTAATEDAYIGLLVSANGTSAASKMVITGLRIKFASDADYTEIDLSQTPVVKTHLP
jgi:hypothetical protein